MGNQQSRGKQSEVQIDHPKFAKATLIKSADKDLLQIHMTTDQKNYQLWKNQLSKIQSQKFKHLMLPLSHNYSANGLCSSSGNAKMTYENFPYLLQDQIQKIKQKKSTFSQCQIWKLLLSIIHAKKQYWEISPNKSNNLGDVRPRNIFLNEKGDIKMANLLSWPNQVDNYKKYFYQQITYLAPQDLEKIQLGVVKNPQNQKSQIFSIGLTLLSLGLTQNFQNLYDLSKQSIDKQKLNKKLNQWKTTLYFSEILRGTVLNLLQFLPDKRMSYEELLKFLQPHVLNIKAMKPLIIKNAPNKLHAQVNDLRRQLPIILQARFQQNATLQKQKTSRKTIESVIKMNKNPSVKQINNKNQYNPLIPIIPIIAQQQRIVTNQTNASNNTNSNQPSIENFLFKKQNQQFNQIAARLVNQQNIQHTDSLVDQFSDKDKIQKNFIHQVNLPLQTIITQRVEEVIPLEQAPEKTIQKRQRFISTIPDIKQPQKSQLKQNLTYHTYVDVIIDAPYDKCWDQFLKLLENPSAYAQGYENIIKTEKVNGEHIISVGKAKVKVQLNKDQGKALFSNTQDSLGSGQILGGVSRTQKGYSQIWFNSSYHYKGQPFPQVDKFQQFLNVMQNNLAPSP